MEKLGKVDRLKEEKLKGLPADRFRYLMGTIGTKAERDRLEKLYNNALKQLSMDDAAKVVGIFKRAWAGDGGADRKTQVLINSGKGVVLTPLYPGLDIDLEDVEVQAAFVRCAFRAICGFWNYLISANRHLGDTDNAILAGLLPTLLRWKSVGVSDKHKPNYENLANMLANTDPIMWAKMYINTQRDADKVDAQSYMYNLIIGEGGKESILPKPLYDLHQNWKLILNTAIMRCTHLQIASESTDSIEKNIWDTMGKYGAV